MLRKLLSRKNPVDINLQEKVYHAPTCRTGRITNRYVSDLDQSVVYSVVWDFEDHLIEPDKHVVFGFVKEQDIKVLGR